MNKDKVVLFGATGTMGRKALEELWRWRDRYDIVLLSRPSRRNRALLRPYQSQAGIVPQSGAGADTGSGLTVVWGDATKYADVERAIRGVDWVLDAMAYISPQADYHPEVARAVNIGGIRNIVRAIESQPQGAERIKLAYTGTVAATGDRLPPIHMGRVGDPLNPSVFDYYAVTKIAGERVVLESKIQHWVSLRMTFIMPTCYRDCIDLLDPIAFHMPLNSMMENITDRDAGYGLVNVLDVADDAGFWRRVYNMSGGPRMRCSAYDFVDRSFKLNGLAGVQACTERTWYALRNFHMQYYEDGAVLNQYLRHWRDSLSDYWSTVSGDIPPHMRLLSSLGRAVPRFRRVMERSTHRALGKMAENHRNGTAYWYKRRNDKRISAFFKDYGTYESIPGWDAGRPSIDAEPEWRHLHHGYDEGKSQLSLEDLQGAARLRGGKCLSQHWDGEWYTVLDWECLLGHAFTAKPYTILKAGHWCPTCAPPPWDYGREARRNPFFSQVWYPRHGHEENDCYPESCTRDIACADED